ncbi:ABC transporter permease [Caproiciproducens galactitolivorans]|uniref:ABC transporter permease n=1 Tax=Caproiciproducens galactitolivorans TaxID=642589 RepID=A0ABT4BU98_9FIRM|nr:ABC transporter permease [Caproiciproducens galactitolivorans]MCY1714449.1 ABC transporter permease [Caproiciproducens galactitolivorans]
MIKSQKEKIQRVLAGLFSIGAFLALWQWAVVSTTLGQLMPGPITVITSFIQAFSVPIGTCTIQQHVGWSLSRVMIAYLVAAVVGIGLGVLMGWNPKIEAIFKPLYDIIRPIPPIAWIPLSIVWFGLGEMTKYFLIFLSAFSNITLNAYEGAKSVDPVLMGASRMLGANRTQTLLTVVLPASMPFIFAGLQVAISTSWATVVAAEMVRSTEGVGWVIVSAQDTNDMNQTLVGILAIGIVGFILATIMRGVETRLCKWNKSE